MKIIDEKGRLFGKISVIDIIVIVFVIVVSALCIYKYVSRDKEEDIKRENEKLVVTFLAEEVPQYVTETLKEGKKVKDSEQRTTIGTVANYNVGPSISYATTFQGDYVKTTKEGYNSVEVTIDGLGYFEDTGVRIGSQLFLVGKYITVEIGEGVYWGRISSIKTIGG